MSYLVSYLKMWKDKDWIVAIEKSGYTHVSGFHLNQTHVGSICLHHFYIKHDDADMWPPMLSRSAIKKAMYGKSLAENWRIMSYVDVQHVSN